MDRLKNEAVSLESQIATLEKEKAERLEREKKEREALEKKRKAEEEARKKAEAEAKAKAEAEQKAWEEEAARVKATRKEELEKKLHWKKDSRIKFVGTVYDSELLKKIRENAFGNFHGHTVGGTNPSLLEALGATDLNLLIDVDFNREVAQDAAMYWDSKEGSLSRLIEKADAMDSKLYAEYGHKAKKRIESAFSWEFIGNEYKKIFDYDSGQMLSSITWRKG